MARVLVIDTEAQAKADELVAYAMDHPYRPGPGVPSPADDPRHIAEFQTYKVVFTFTYLRGELMRHMSVSVPTEGKYPNEFAVLELAKLCGFDPTKTSFAMGASKVERCAVVVQRVNR